MKLLSKFINFTLIGKTYNLIISIKDYIKDYNYIGEALYSDNFKKLLNTYLNINIKQDWIGRLYGVINPIIDIEGNMNLNSVIIEIDGKNSNTDEYVKHWCYKQLMLISQLFKIENLYNYINLTFTKVGPEEYDNYLLIFDIASRKKMSSTFKKFIKHFLLYCIIISILLFIF